jgi:hypothetical protein
MYSGTRRKFMKVTVMVDVRWRRACRGRGHRSRRLPRRRSVGYTGKKVVKLYGDGAYDSDVVFEVLADAGAEAAIRIGGTRGRTRLAGGGRR